MKFNSTRKYVVSHEPRELGWANSTLITDAVVPQLQALKQRGGHDLWVHGSGNLIQTLDANQLVDRMHIWTFPITVGPKGKRFFAEGTLAAGWKLIDSKTATPGVIIATYEPAEELKVGSFAQ